MNSFTWGNSHAVGIPELDADHRALFRIAEQLYDGINDGTAKDRLAGLLARLGAYTRFHFEHEEALMRRTGYSEYEGHRREHQAFTAMLKELQSRPAEPNALMVFLRTWIEEHTCGADHRMVEHIKQVETNVKELRNVNKED